MRFSDIESISLWRMALDGMAPYYNRQKSRVHHQAASRGLVDSSSRNRDTVAAASLLIKHFRFERQSAGGEQRRRE